MDTEIQRLKEMIEESEKIVFFTGAGVSVASGFLIFAQWAVYLMRFQKMDNLQNIY